MLRKTIVGLIAGVVLLVLDGIINANPLAQRLYAAYQPIARPGVTRSQRFDDHHGKSPPSGDQSDPLA